MELRSLNELRKRRKKLVKLLEYPRRPENPIEQQIDELCKKTIRKEIADIDAEIRERTATDLIRQDRDVASP